MLAFARPLANGLAVFAWLGAVAVLLMLPGCGEGGVRFANGLVDRADRIEAVDDGTFLVEGEPYRLAGLAASTSASWDWCGPLDLSAPNAPA
jgi:hypothetical protein